MSVLVADVGGTNTRLARLDDGRLGPAVRMRNDDHASFADLLAAHLRAQALPSLSGCCIAVAGPVTAAQARLTNRDWAFDTAEIAGLLGLGAAADVWLVNDLAAHGRALALLGDTQMADLRAPRAAAAAGNGQSLVVGLGTGFNVCLVAAGSHGPVVAEAELGHASLPETVARALRGALGDAGPFVTNEHLFSGRGLARLHREVSGGRQRRGEDILTAYGQAGAGVEARTVELMARLLGQFARELVFTYLPLGGLYFVGGAARGLLGSPARSAFLQAFSAPGPLSDQIGQVPLRLVTDDSTALIGAAEIARAVQRPTA